MTGSLDFDPHPDAKEGHSLWGGRFGERMADAMVGLNRSLDVDVRLWPQDIRASQAWSRALSAAGVLTEVEAAEIARDAGVGHLLYYHVVPPTPLPGLEAAWLAGVDEVFNRYTLGVDGTGFSLPADSSDIVPLDQGRR